MDAVEYALRKVVRNNPIVREVDEVRQRELWQWVCVGLVLVLVLLFSAWQRSELLRHGYGIQDLQQKRAQEAETARHLRLKIEQLRAPRRVEVYATTRLNLIRPGQGDAIVIERVTPPGRPASSVVAAR
jgi:hypothetical protein